MLNGIDISNHQRGIKLKNVGADFCICKASEGVGWKDPTFDGFMEDADSCGKLLGMYHFARTNDAVDEADSFISACGRWWGSAIPVLDYEGDALKNGAGWCKRFLDRVRERTGATPMIYMSAYNARGIHWQPIIDAGYPLWVAAYHSNADMDYSGGGSFNWDIRPWESWKIWQFTSSGHIGGYNGRLDLNHADMTYPEWDRMARGSEPMPVYPKNEHTVTGEEMNAYFVEDAADKVTMAERIHAGVPEWIPASRVLEDDQVRVYIERADNKLTIGIRRK